MAAATAEVTSIPVVLEPELAARILLISIAEFVVVVDDKSELTAEVVLMASTYIPGKRHRARAFPLAPGSEHREPESWPRTVREFTQIATRRE
jgi:hypothetical protein